jgi:hypothetical protein
MKWAGLGAYTGDKRIAHRILVGKPLRREKVQYATTDLTCPVKLEVELF